MSRYLWLSLLAVPLLLPSTAEAGGCTTCMSNADCTVVQPDAVCVRWNLDIGCGMDRLLCCPGQGCALGAGGPSCVAAGQCELVEPGPDAGAPPADAGPTDATVLDTGTTTTSTRPPPSGPRPPGTARDRPGCVCATGEPASGLALLLVIGGLALFRRRRR